MLAQKLKQLKQVSGCCIITSHLMLLITCTISITNVANEDNLESMNSTPAHCLKLPGKKLDLTALLYAKWFRNHGYKKGALSAFRELEEAGLGTTEERKGKNGTVRYLHLQCVLSFIIHNLHLQQRLFHKAVIPATSEEKAEFMKKLLPYNMSLVEYSNALQQEEIK